MINLKPLEVVAACRVPILRTNTVQGGADPPSLDGNRQWIDRHKVVRELSCNLPRCKGTPERTTCGKTNEKKGRYSYHGHRTPICAGKIQLFVLTISSKRLFVLARIRKQKKLNKITALRSVTLLVEENLGE
ncbi:hypothetical protein KQX54_015207 [Cotesia glomerata]|uniref:Uncharacterized protein n=1 Tax=Cotesia glomerata TaxID=32391 RepID=A0AAV7IT52_COTGL|nr:hypothetical protein KQX54_015207 [Cotesia glomerata]